MATYFILQHLEKTLKKIRKRTFSSKFIDFLNTLWKHKILYTCTNFIMENQENYLERKPMTFIIRKIQDCIFLDCCADCACLKSYLYVANLHIVNIQSSMLGTVILWRQTIYKPKYIMHAKIHIGINVVVCP